MNCKKIAAGNRATRDQHFRHMARRRHRFCRQGWWRREGRRRYPNAQHLLIPADTSGGHSESRGARLQRLLCDRLGLTVTVARYPTGASKYNPVEHRLFSQIAKNRATEPLTDYSRSST